MLPTTNHDLYSWGGVSKPRLMYRPGKIPLVGAGYGIHWTDLDEDNVPWKARSL